VTLCRLPRLTRGFAVSARRESAAASAAAAQYGIKTGRLDAPIASLSGGNQQKAILARALLTEPRVLLLDDPTRGVDVGAKADLYRLIDRLCRHGMGVVVTSSELPELLLLCDRILVLREGRLMAEFRRSDGFSEQSIMEVATRGLAEER
jgi:ABC-type sugar transport system ATPase subunit